MKLCQQQLDVMNLKISWGQIVPISELTALNIQDILPEDCSHVLTMRFKEGNGTVPVLAPFCPEFKIERTHTGFTVISAVGSFEKLMKLRASISQSIALRKIDRLKKKVTHFNGLINPEFEFPETKALLCTRMSLGE